MRRIVKHFTRLSCYLVIAISLAIIAATLWLGQGPRNINWARGWLLSAMNPEGAPYKIDISDVSINWQDMTDFGHLRVKNMQVSKAGGEIFAMLPQVNVTLDALGFLPHHRLLHGIQIESPRLFMTRNEDGVINLGLEGVEQPLPFGEFVSYFSSEDAEADDSRGRLPFREFSLENASLHFTDTATGAQLAAEPLNFRIRRVGHDLGGNLSLPFIYKEVPGRIEARLSTNAINGSRLLDARVQQLPAELVCMFAPCPAEQQFAGSISGKATVNVDSDQRIGSMNFALSTEKASFTAPAWFPKPLKLKKAGLIGKAYNDFTAIEIEGLTLETKDTKLALKATATKKQDGWYAQGEGVDSRLDISKLANYWPIPLAPDSRTWVTSHITSGFSDSATITFNVTPEDIEGDTIRDEAMHALVNAENLTVDYLPGFPKLTNVSGPVTFTGKRIWADVKSGTMLSGTVLQPSKIAFTNLDIPATPTETSINLTAPAKDVAQILQHKIFTFDDALGLNPATISGDVQATLKLKFDAFSNPNAAPDEINLNAVDYDITTTLTNIGQPDLMGRNIKGLNGTLTATNKEVNFNGGVKVDGTDIALTLHNDDAETTATAKGTLTRAQFTQLGIPDMPELGEGSLGVDAEVKLGKNSTTLKRAELDLTNMALSLPQISWKKPVGGAAKLSLTPGNAANSYGLRFTAPDMTLSGGTLTLTPALDDVAAFTIGHLKTSNNDFALSYKTTADGYDVNLSGDRLDNSDAFMAPPDDTPEDSLLAAFPPVNLTIDLKQLMLYKDRPLENVKGTLECNRTRCPHADLSAKAGSGTLRATIASTGGARRLKISSDNAGDTLRALDISDRMYGGTLDMQGTYDDGKTPPLLGGRVLIHNFKLKNSEILARILSVASLSGIVNLLTGQGIDFEKMGMDYTHAGGVMTVSKGRAESAALGITVEGTIDTSRDQMKLNGAVIPANLLNSFLGKIPLIGAIAGGDEGLIAFKYAVTGKVSDPEVSVNPLSGLTPGFLRGIWGDGTATPAGDGKSEPVIPGSGSKKSRDMSK